MLRENLSYFNCLNIKILKLAHYSVDFTTYKLESEGMQNMTKRKVGEGSTFLLALSIVRMRNRTVIWEAGS